MSLLLHVRERPVEEMPLPAAGLVPRKMEDGLGERLRGAFPDDGLMDEPFPSAPLPVHEADLRIGPRVTVREIEPGERVSPRARVGEFADDGENGPGKDLVDVAVERPAVPRSPHGPVPEVREGALEREFVGLRANGFRGVPAGGRRARVRQHDLVDERSQPEDASPHVPRVLVAAQHNRRYSAQNGILLLNDSILSRMTIGWFPSKGKAFFMSNTHEVRSTQSG